MDMHVLYSVQQTYHKYCTIECNKDCFLPQENSAQNEGCVIVYSILCTIGTKPQNPIVT